MSKPLALKFIASLCCNITDSSLLDCGKAVLEYLSSLSQEERYSTGGIGVLAIKCRQAFSKDAACGFWLMVGLIRLAHECDRYVVRYTYISMHEEMTY